MLDGLLDFVGRELAKLLLFFTMTATSIRIFNEIMNKCIERECSQEKLYDFTQIFAKYYQPFSNLNFQMKRHGKN